MSLLLASALLGGRSDWPAQPPSRTCRDVGRGAPGVSAGHPRPLRTARHGPEGRQGHTECPLGLGTSAAPSFRLTLVPGLGFGVSPSAPSMRAAWAKQTILAVPALLEEPGGAVPMRPPLAAVTLSLLLPCAAEPSNTRGVLPLGWPRVHSFGPAFPSGAPGVPCGVTQVWAAGRAEGPRGESRGPQVSILVRSSQRPLGLT